MIHAYIALVIFLLVAFACRRSRGLKFVFLTLSAVLVIFVVVATTGGVEVMSKVPIIVIENSETIELEYSGSFYLIEGGNSAVSREFVMSNKQTLEDIENYLEGSIKPIYIFIKDGEDIVYKANKGVLTKEHAQEILDTYLTWKRDGTLPNPRIRYNLFIFYFDV